MKFLLCIILSSFLAACFGWSEPDWMVDVDWYQKDKEGDRK